MPTCQRCGSFVTTDFTRVFGGNENRAFACLGCTAVVDLCEGKAARPGA